MAFLAQGTATPRPAAPAKPAAASMPILTSLFYFAGVIELVCGGLIVFASLRDKSQSLPAAMAAGAAVIMVALVLFGIGQVVHYLARSAAAAERTAAAAERLATDREVD